MERQSVKIALYAGHGTHPRLLARALRGWGFPVTLVRDEDIEELGRSDFGLLYLPGGWYQFGQKANQAILDFVREGGGCVGSCAGAYLVAGTIPVIPGRVLRSNVRGRLYLEPQAGNHPILRGIVRKCLRHKGRRWEPIAVTHQGGPMMFPADPSHIVASYDWEGEVGAVVAAPVGRGRAVAISSHPELPLASLPRSDPARKGGQPLRQGDQRLLVRNAVLWALKRRVPKEGRGSLPHKATNGRL
jgi:glutamine amidotransferase-like uncharacterized protein